MKCACFRAFGGVPRRSRGLWGVALVVALAAPLLAQAPKPDITLGLTPIVPRSRNGAMLLVEARLATSLQRVVEGTLELTYFVGNQRLLQISVPDIALTRGEMVMQLSLPAPPHVLMDQLAVDARFIEPGRVHDLGQQFLSAPTFNQRAFVIAISDPWMGSLRRLGDLPDSLRLERFEPRKADEVWREPIASTSPVSLQPQRLPTSAIGYTPFDMVLLADEGFAVTPPRALEAMVDWVRAGGSLLVMPSTRLEQQHVAFLAALAADTPNPPTFALDERGRLAVEPMAKLHRLHAGLGRVVIAGAAFDPEQELQGREWTQAVLFLWKVRKGQWEAMTTGAWEAQQTKHGLSIEDIWGQATQTPEAQAQAVPSLPVTLAPAFEPTAFLHNLLSPQSLRLVPLSLIAGLLAAYILAIGPLDYLVLGRLRRRVWTWAALPLVTVLATAAMMNMSARYMGGSHVRRSLHVIDLAGREPLRATQLSLKFSAADHEDVTEYRQALFSPLMSSDLMGRFDAMERTTWTTVEGRPPGQFTVRQRMGQWTLSLRRVAVIKPAMEPHVDLGAFTHADLLLPESRERLAAAVAQQTNHRGSLYIVHQNERQHWALREGRPLPRNLDPIDRQGVLLQPLGLGVAESQNLFSIVSQISPTGGPSLEDLAILDPTDPDQWLVVVEIHDGDDIYHYRQLVRRKR